MNIALDWFLRFGNSGELDARTARNVITLEFVAHAKSCATEEECRLIDNCIIHPSTNNNEEKAK